jgi:very-short-patch-repair endonuclease
MQEEHRWDDASAQLPSPLRGGWPVRRTGRVGSLMARTSISYETRTKARDHRKHLSKAERILWWHLRELKSEGFRFRRQAPVGPYIVDFAWFSARIVVELDGDNHETETQKRHDKNRDAFLKERGFQVLRFSNWDAIDVPEWVIARIKGAIAAHVEQPHPAAPAERPPSPQGGGEPVGALGSTPPPAAPAERPPSPQGGGRSRRIRQETSGPP